MQLNKKFGEENKMKKIVLVLCSALFCSAMVGAYQNDVLEYRITNRMNELSRQASILPLLVPSNASKTINPYTVIKKLEKLKRICEKFKKVSLNEVDSFKLNNKQAIRDKIEEQFKILIDFIEYRSNYLFTKNLYPKEKIKFSIIFCLNFAQNPASYLKVGYFNSTELETYAEDSIDFLKKQKTNSFPVLLVLARQNIIRAIKF